MRTSVSKQRDRAGRTAILDLPDRITALDADARAAFAKGKYDRAAALAGKAVKLAAKVGRPRLTAVLLARRGEALDAGGRFQDAAEVYEDALDALRAVPELGLDRVPKRDMMGDKFYYAEGPIFDLRLASVDPLPESLEEAEGDPGLVLRLLLDLGNLYLAQPQPGRAEVRYDDAQKRPELSSHPRLHAHLLTQILIARGLRAALREPDEAASQIGQALRLFAAHAPGERRHALVARAAIEQMRGQPEAAVATLAEALPLYRGGPRRARRRPRPRGPRARAPRRGPGARGPRGLRAGAGGGPSAARPRDRGVRRLGDGPLPACPGRPRRRRARPRRELGRDRAPQRAAALRPGQGPLPRHRHRCYRHAAGGPAGSGRDRSGALR